MSKKKSIIELNLNAGATENLEASWLPVTEPAGETRETNRRRYPTAELPVTIDADGKIGLLTDSETMYVDEDGKLVANITPHLLEGEGTRVSDNHVSVNVDGETVAIDPDTNSLFVPELGTAASLDVCDDADESSYDNVWTGELSYASMRTLLELIDAQSDIIERISEQNAELQAQVSALDDRVTELERGSYIIP